MKAIYIIVYKIIMYHNTSHKLIFLYIKDYLQYKLLNNGLKKIAEKSLINK